MKRILFLPFLLLFWGISAAAQEVPTAPYLPAQASPEADQAPITVQYPYEQMTLPRGAKQIFLFGKVNLKPPVKLEINGTPVPVEKNGAFVAYLPVQYGNFEFLLTAANKTTSAQAVRRVIIPGVDTKDFSAQAAFDPQSVFPQTPTELLPGDEINLSVRGTPNATVTATLSGLKNAKNLALQEDPFNPGIYQLYFTVDPEQKPKAAKVVYKMKEPAHGTTAKITAPHKIQIRSAKDPFFYAQVTEPGVKLRQIPTPRENLYPFYRAYGQVRLNGQLNNQYRLVLNENESAWLEETKLELTPHEDFVPNRITGLRTEVLDEKTRLIFTGKRPTPIRIRELGDRLELAFYYVEGFDKNFTLGPKSPLVEDVAWTQPDNNTLLFTIYFKKNTQLWGHAYDFENGDLVLDLIHPPLLTPTLKQPLKGARILLAAGHSPRRTVPYDGAVGPTGYLEYEATLALAQDLKPLLERAGATVIMTRHGNNTISLQSRYEKAIRERAQILVSLHYNSLPETSNPFAGPRGFSVYYNYPHSFRLAQSVHEAFTRRVPLPDNGLIANDVLFIPRIPQLPSILVENAFLLMPKQEEMAKTKRGREPLVRALYAGIVDFYDALNHPNQSKARQAVQKFRRKFFSN